MTGVFEAGVKDFDAAEVGFDVAAFVGFEVRGMVVVPNFCVVAGLGVFKISSGADAVGVGSDPTSTWAGGRSFLQFSRKELGSPFVCLSEAFKAFAVRGTSVSSVGASFFHLLDSPNDDGVTKAGGI